LVKPTKELTHELDHRKSSDSLGVYQIRSDKKYYDKVTFQKLEGNPKPLTGVITDIQESDWGGFSYKVKFDNKERWICAFLLNAPRITPIPEKQIADYIASQA
jgi:hypothetical protein